MSDHKLLLPAMGEGVMEATVTNWLKQVGDKVEEDESVVEIATDKVDSDVPTPVSGIIKEILVQKDGVAKIGETLAILEIEGDVAQAPENSSQANEAQLVAEASQIQEEIAELETPLAVSSTHKIESNENNFYSPLVKSIAEKEYEECLVKAEPMIQSLK